MKRFSRLQTTHPTSGGTSTAVTNCCANCVEPSRPQQWGPDIPFFGKPAMRMLSAAPQTQTNESVFAISAINTYKLGSRYP